MENSNYTMEDIAKFICDYKEENERRLKESVIKVPNNFKERIANIPIVGRRLYQKRVLEESKINFFEQKYIEALNGTIEQQELIKQMAPILDDYYSKREEQKSSKR